MRPGRSHRTDDPLDAAARSLVLSGALTRRIEQLASLVPRVIWTPAGAGNIPVEQIHQLLAQARKGMAARRGATDGRWARAVQAFEAAEALARHHSAALRAARQQARLRDLEARADHDMLRSAALPRIGNEAKRIQANTRAARYVKAAEQIRSRRGGLSLSQIARLLAETPPRGTPRRSAHQIFRHLRRAGLE
jgi:hypothetical protein